MDAIGIIAGAALSDARDGGGGAYTASAVSFNGSTFLSNQSLTALGDASGYCSFVYWFKFAPEAYEASPPFWVVDPNGNYTSNSFLVHIDETRAFINNQFCNSADSICIEGDWDTAHDIPNDNGWHQLAVSVKINELQGSKVFSIYLDGVALGVTVTHRSTGPTTLTFNNTPFYAFSDGYGQCIAGDIADFWFAPGQFVDWSNPANMAKVRDVLTGKPVDLGANGELVTGTAPAIFFSGNAAGFASNKGTGGAFAFNEGGALTNAATSPSD